MIKLPLQLALLALAGGITATAATLLPHPVLTPDGQAIDYTAPQWGADVYAIAGSSWEIWFNDNYKNRLPGVHGDLDGNDAVLSMLFGSAIDGIVTGTVQYTASVSADHNLTRLDSSLPWMDVGQSQTYSYAEGSIVPAFMLDATHNNIFETGPAGNNPDCTIHAWVDGQVPEASTWMLIGTGLMLLGWRRYAVS